MAEAPGILLLNAEDNDLSGLTITEEGSNDFSITTGAALHGTYGYNFAFDGTKSRLYMYKSFTSGADIYSRCYFYIPSSFSFASGSEFVLFMLRASSFTTLIIPRFFIFAGVFRLYRIDYTTNAGEFSYSCSVNISRDAGHFIELRYKSDSSSGIVEVYLDGSLVLSLTNLNTSNYRVGYVWTGNASSGVPTSGSAFYIDDIKVNSSYIGAYADSGGVLPAIINNYRQQGVM